MKLKLKICVNKLRKLLKRLAINIKKLAGAEIDEHCEGHSDSDHIHEEAKEIEAKLKFVMENAVNEYQASLNAKKRE